LLVLSNSSKINFQSHIFTQIKPSRLPICVVLTQTSIFLHSFLFFFCEFMLLKIGLWQLPPLYNTYDVKALENSFSFGFA